MLLVREHAKIVDQLKSSLLLAVVANLRLSDFTSLNKNGALIVASGTFVVGLFHFGDSVTASYDNTFQCDKFVNLKGIKLTDLILLLHVEGPHLNDSIILVLLDNTSLIRLILDLLLEDL